MIVPISIQRIYWVGFEVFLATAVEQLFFELVAIEKDPSPVLE